MNRTYAIPAAIALTAHALLFVGSGKPPTKTAPEKKIVKTDDALPPEEVIYQKAVKLIEEEPPVNPNPSDNSASAGSVEPPPGIPELPRFDPSNEERMEQTSVHVDYGHGDKTTSLRLLGTENGNGNGLGKAMITSDMLDKQPRTRFQKEPAYPSAMKTTGAAGTVWVEFMVDETGRIHDVHVIKTTNHGFDDATVAAVSQWRFEPGKRNGIPVTFRMSIPVVYNLTD